MSLDQYYLLGRSGLRVSRLALGTMNFGTGGFHAAYGKTADEARPIFRRYVDAGGNFIDTADFYTAGRAAHRRRRDTPAGYQPPVLNWR